MKRLISLLAVALFGVALVGCSDNEETTPPTPPDPKPVDVYGWHMTKWEVGGDDTNFPKEVYIVFDEEKNFEMYQDVSSNGFVKMTGTPARRAAAAMRAVFSKLPRNLPVNIPTARIGHTTIPYPVWTGFSASSIKKPGR